MIAALVWLQAATFVGLGCSLCARGSWRLGAAQLALAAVTGLVYL